MHHFELIPGDRLLLCSDGLSGMMRDQDIAAELVATFDPQPVCDALIRRALANGGQDNVTVVLVALGPAVAESAVGRRITARRLRVSDMSRHIRHYVILASALVHRRQAGRMRQPRFDHEFNRRHQVGSTKPTRSTRS